MLTWTAPASAGGSPITHYLVEQRSATTPYVWTTLGTTTAVKFLVRGLTNGVTTWFRVVAVSAIGRGAHAYVAVNPTIPEAPRIAESPGSHNGRAYIGWYWLSDYPVTFRVEYRPVGTSAWTWAATRPSAGYYQYVWVSGLTNGVTYEVRVGAIYEIGISWAAPIRQAPRSTPAAPRNLRVSSGPSVVFVDWDPPSTNGGATISKYRVELSLDGVHWTGGPNNRPPAAVDRTVLWADIPSTAGSMVYVRVMASNYLGWGPYSSPVALRVGTYPDPPGAFRASPGNRSIDLRWTRPVFTGYRPLVEYTVQVSAFGSGQWRTVASTSATSHRVTGLSNGVHYCVRVIAWNNATLGHAALPTAFYAGSWRAYDPSGRGCFR